MINIRAVNYDSFSRIPVAAMLFPQSNGAALLLELHHALSGVEVALIVGRLALAWRRLLDIGRESRVRHSGRSPTAPAA